MTLRTLLILVNVAAVAVIVVVIAARVLSAQREPTEKDPANLTPFYDDDTLEDAHLTRVLRWALVFSTIVAVVLPLYWVLEPNRQDQEAAGFDDRAIERGATLFANSSMPAYDSAKSLLCADCHGADGGGGAAPFVLTPEAQGNANANPVQESWVAPSLNDVTYRFTEDPTAGWQQITQVITYGRPGTPMPAWGVAGGGPKNTQAVSDLVAYLQSIQVTPAKARAQAAKKIKDFKAFAKGQTKTARDALATAQEKLATAVTPAQKELYQGKVDAAQEGITRSQEFATQVAKMSEGELLFDTQCARCHTKGWSTLEPSNGFVPMPGLTGGGAFGPNLRDGSTTSQFPGDTGTQKQYDWVATGVEPNKGYGVRGISSGRMPHFGQILTKRQIEAVIEFERSL